MPRFQASRVLIISILVLTTYVCWHRFQAAFAVQQHVAQHDFLSFGSSIAAALQDHAPGIAPIQRTGDAPALVFWRADDTTPRPDFLKLPPNDVAIMKAAHTSFLGSAKKLTPPFLRGTSGIVSAASGKYLPVFVISLRMVRRTGCTLPVELFVDSEDEISSHLCKDLLPKLDARCVRLQDRLGPWTTNLAKFQVKVFAIVASFFENVLFLDADAFLAKDASHIFTSEPFLSTGLVTWPDFWASSASPHLYEVMGQPAPAMNALASTESGQLAVSKASHSTTLLLAAYYNFHGPSFYYLLLGQGGPGEGDKDTFIAAARAVNAPFYQVKKCVDTIGYYEQGQYHGGAMLQYDPTQDSTEQVPSVPTMDKTPDAFSVHHNIPKYDPVELFKLGVLVDATTGIPHRLIGTEELTQQRFGRDIERELWEEIEYVACELGDKIVGWKTISTAGTEKGTCDKVRWYRATVFASATPS